MPIGDIVLIGSGIAAFGSGFVVHDRRAGLAIAAVLSVILFFFAKDMLAMGAAPGGRDAMAIGTVLFIAGMTLALFVLYLIGRAIGGARRSN